MARVRVQAVRHLAGAAESLAQLPSDVVEAIYEQFELYVGQELDAGDHVQRVSVEGRAVSVSFFIDTDGTLWIKRLEPAAWFSRPRTAKLSLLSPDNSRVRKYGRASNVMEVSGQAHSTTNGGTSAWPSLHDSLSSLLTTSRSR